MINLDSLDFLRDGGVFHLECFDGKTGELKWTEDIHNTVLNVGKNLALDILFDGSTSKIITWHLGVSNDSTSVTASYSLSGEVGTRQATTWSRTGQTVTSQEKSFTGITDTVRKAFVVTASSGGTVFAVSDLSTARTLTSSDILKITYSISAS